MLTEHLDLETARKLKELAGVDAQVTVKVRHIVPADGEAWTDYDVFIQRGDKRKHNYRGAHGHGLRMFNAALRAFIYWRYENQFDDFEDLVAQLRIATKR